MKTDKIIAALRKDKGWSQSELAKQTGVSQVMIGKYERGDATPSLDVAKKIADALEVSLDYLVGEGQNSKFDKTTVNRLHQIENMDSATKEKMWFFIDAILRDFQSRKTYAS